MKLPDFDPMPSWLEDVWLERYLNRALNQEESAGFEAYMLDKPRLLDLVELDLALADALRADAAKAPSVVPQAAQMEAITAAANNTPSAAKPRSKWASFNALAASLVLGVGAGFWAAKQSISAPTIASSPPRLVFDSMRGAITTNLNEPGSAASTMYIVEVAVPPDAQVLSAIAVVNGRDIALQKPVVSSDGFVTFVFPVQWRDQSTLELKWTAAGSSEPLQLVFKI